MAFPASPDRTDRPDPTDRIKAIRALARASRYFERSTDELSLAHYRVLSSIATGDERASRVAERLAVGKPAISAAVEALSQRGLLARSGAQRDQRVSTLRLTPEGQALLERVEGQLTERMEQLYVRTPDADQIVQSLISLDAALEEYQRARKAGVNPP